MITGGSLEQVLAFHLYFRDLTLDLLVIHFDHLQGFMHRKERERSDFDMLCPVETASLSTTLT